MGPGQGFAQTFTAGISGGLDQVDLVLGKVDTPPGPATVEIRDASAGQPGTGVLAAATIPLSAIGTAPAFVPATFATPAPVTAGTQYTIVVYADGDDGGSVSWGYQHPDGGYPGGSMFSTSTGLPPGPPWTPLGDLDTAFKTYVVPAVPSAPAPPTDQATGTCKGKPATIAGTEGDDELNGTPNRDVIAALGGDDEIRGFGGKDLICGGEGKDLIKGGKGNDKLYGEGGKDKLFGQKGKDKLFGQKGRDRLNGGGAKDVCKGGKGKDSASCEIEKSI
jgi:Ca2+-binding RTX toxin-like protein